MLELESPRSPIADPPLSAAGAARSADAGAIPKVSKQSSSKPSRHLSDSGKLFDQISNELNYCLVNSFLKKIQN